MTRMRFSSDASDLIPTRAAAVPSQRAHSIERSGESHCATGGVTRNEAALRAWAKMRSHREDRRGVRQTLGLTEQDYTDYLAALATITSTDSPVLSALADELLAGSEPVYSSQASLPQASLVYGSDEITLGEVMDDSEAYIFAEMALREAGMSTSSWEDTAFPEAVLDAEDIRSGFTITRPAPGRVPYGWSRG